MTGTTLGSAPIHASAKPPRRRAAMIAVFSILVFVAIASACGLSWDDGPAMAFGEMIGLIAPLAVFGVAALALHALWKRAAR